MRKAIPLLLLAAFLAALTPRMLSSLAQGDAYPEWSTLRSDPLGAKVLYEALRQIPGMRVERGFESWGEAPPRPVQYVFLGGTPAELWNTQAWERILSAGGAVLLAPRMPVANTATRTEKLGFIVSRERHKQAVLQLWSNAWRCVAGSDAGCIAAERKFGGGTLTLLADGSWLRNGELFRKPRTAELAGLFRADIPVVFDESHLGVEDNGGVGVLMRRYGLLPVMGLLAVFAVLFVWRNSVSLLPQRENVTAAMSPQPAASLVTLLEQSVPRGKLLETIVLEWKRAQHLAPGWMKGRAEELESALRSTGAQKDPRQGYEELREILSPRRGAA